MRGYSMFSWIWDKVKSLDEQRDYGLPWYVMFYEVHDMYGQCDIINVSGPFETAEDAELYKEHAPIHLGTRQSRWGDDKDTNIQRVVYQLTEKPWAGFANHAIEKLKTDLKKANFNYTVNAKKIEEQIEVLSNLNKE